MFDTASPELLRLQEVLAGRYSLERELGRGGMGIVWLAHEVRLDRPVALKLLPPELAAQPALRERFLREARTAAKLSHPHIVPIHAVDEADDFVFFAMAYVDGHTLGQRVRERGPVPPREATRILREVAWALGYAHAQGVVHRDVKPDNILLESGTGRALVTDFGIAQVTEGPGLTSTREVLGTAEFMSPEQASGDAVDERSDIYSLGIVAHYMLSGSLPFEGATVAATLAKQITQPAPSLAAAAPETPRPLAELVGRCLAKDPAERFAGGEELAEELGLVLRERREVPAALRAFVNEHRERMKGAPGVLFTVVYMLVAAVLVAIDGAPLSLAIVLAGLSFLMALAPPWMLVRMARELLRAGHGHEELLLALKSEIRTRREELASHFAGKPAWYDRLALGLTWGGLAVASVATGAMFLIDSFGGMVAAGLTVVLGGLTSMVAGPFAATAFKRRRRVSGTRWLKFWESRFGRWIFRVARTGLRGLPSAGGAYRPTEMAIGMAADRLFEELPRDLRKQFSELPAVVRTLEAHAESVRARIEELDGIGQAVERDPTSVRATPATPPGTADRRDSISGEIRAAREAAEARLAEVVAALETIRLQLLRMHAGVGSVEGMTADLGSGMELSEEIERLLEAGREVDSLLGTERPEPAGDAPTPQPA